MPLVQKLYAPDALILPILVLEVRELAAVLAPDCMDTVGCEVLRQMIRPILDYEEQRRAVEEEEVDAMEVGEGGEEEEEEKKKQFSGMDLLFTVANRIAQPRSTFAANRALLEHVYSGMSAATLREFEQWDACLGFAEPPESMPALAERILKDAKTQVKLLQ